MKDQTEEIKTQLANRKCTGVRMCEGDDDHPPHMSIEFEDLCLELLHMEGGFGVLLI
jgi:hypothetical protein